MSTEIYMENASRELAQSVIERSKRFGRDCFTEAAQDAHEGHDDPQLLRNRSCVHCAIYRHHQRGYGHAAALVSVAQSCMDSEEFYPPRRRMRHLSEAGA